MKTAVLVLAALMGLSAAGDYRQNSQDCFVKYPNIPGETLLENDRLVVQKFVVRPGQWEGIHTHPGNQLYVHIKGGKWAVRYGEKEDVSVLRGWVDRLVSKGGAQPTAPVRQRRRDNH